MHNLHAYIDVLTHIHTNKHTHTCYPIWQICAHFPRTISFIHAHTLGTSNACTKSVLDKHILMHTNITPSSYSTMYTAIACKGYAPAAPASSTVPLPLCCAREYAVNASRATHKPAAPTHSTNFFMACVSLATIFARRAKSQAVQWSCPVASPAKLALHTTVQERALAQTQ
jgi:hypothetical protein